MRRVTVLGALACAASLGMPPATLAAGTGTPWIHVRVEDGKKPSKVAVNIPLSVADAVLAAAPSDIVAKGKLHIGCHGRGVSIASLRKAWAELRKAGDTELVSVEEEDQTVKIAREADRVHVRVTSTRKGEKVNIEVPVAAVDALFAGEGEDLDLRGALEEIRKVKGDVVQVDDGDSKVRIWIDEEI
jgi:hypothetical protein